MLTAAWRGATALQKRYPDTMGEGVEGAEEAIEMFRRKWVYYLCVSRSVVSGQHVLSCSLYGPRAAPTARRASRAGAWAVRGARSRRCSRAC